MLTNTNGDLKVQDSTRIRRSKLLSLHIPVKKQMEGSSRRVSIFPIEDLQSANGLGFLSARKCSKSPMVKVPVVRESK